MNRTKRFLVLVVMVLLLGLGQQARAQHWALSTNAVDWATASPNIGVEARFGMRWSGLVQLSYNPWSFKDNKKWKHISAMPEVRYWLCDAFMGHFLSAVGVYSHYNAGHVKLPFGLWQNLKTRRYQGDLAGFGLGYGYNLVLGKHWSLEFEAALGVMWTHFHEYECKHCGTELGERSKTFVAPTKLAVNVVYYMK